MSSSCFCIREKKNVGSMPGHFYIEFSCKMYIQWYNLSFVCINWIFYHHQSLISLSNFFFFFILFFFVSYMRRRCRRHHRRHSSLDSLVQIFFFPKQPVIFLLFLYLFVHRCTYAHTHTHGRLRTQKNCMYWKVGNVQHYHHRGYKNVICLHFCTISQHVYFLEAIVWVLF